MSDPRLSLKGLVVLVGSGHSCKSCSRGNLCASHVVGMKVTLASVRRMLLACIFDCSGYWSRASW